jgi:hypothetical protein
MLYLSEADPYEPLRDVVHPELAKLPPEQLEAALRLHGVEAEGLNDFLGAISQVGAQVGQRLPSISQGALQGASMGAAAGPYGALLGALGGAVAGGLTAPARPAAPQPAPAAPQAAHAPPAPPAAAAPAAPAPVPMPVPTVGTAGSPAAAQLLGLLAQPQVLQALIAMSLGGAGARTVPVAGADVPVAAVPSALSVLANQAASEYVEVFGDESAVDVGETVEPFDAVEPVEAAPRPLPPRRVRRRPAPERVWVEQATYERVYA